MTVKIGPTFSSELAAAGLLGSACSWCDDGTYNIASLTPAQQATFLQVLAAHDPTKQPVASCQLWQLQAVMTPAQWSAAQSAIAALNSAAVSAFFAHGANVIPGNSATLVQLGAALGLTADQAVALVAEAAAVSIP